MHYATPLLDQPSLKVQHSFAHKCDLIPKLVDNIKWNLLMNSSNTSPHIRSKKFTHLFFSSTLCPPWQNLTGSPHISRYLDFFFWENWWINYWNLKDYSIINILISFPPKEVGVSVLIYRELNFLVLCIFSLPLSPGKFGVPKLLFLIKTSTMSFSKESESEKLAHQNHWNLRWRSFTTMKI